MKRFLGNANLYEILVNGEQIGVVLTSVHLIPICETQPNALMDDPCGDLR